MQFQTFICFFFTANKRFQQQPNGLHIEQVTLEDGGLYVCRGTQTHPMISDFKEMNITLKIQRESYNFSIFFHVIKLKI